MATITQDMKYRQSLMKYASTYGVSKASRKYNRARSYIYFWLNRWDGSVESLRPESRRPHYHPNQHTQAELKLIHDMRRRNPRLGMVEFWCKLRNRGYSRTIESLYRVLKREGLIAEKKKDSYKPKPYHQMTHPGERIQIDVKVVPRKCIANPELRLFQYTAIDEYSRYRILGAYPEQCTYSSYLFLCRVIAEFKRKGVRVECVQTDNGIEFTNRFAHGSGSKRKTMFEEALEFQGIQHKLIRPYTPRHNGKVERSHREDQKRFYDTHSFFSLADFGEQLAVHQRRSNSLPMRPLHWASPMDTLKSFTVQYV